MGNELQFYKFAIVRDSLIIVHFSFFSITNSLARKNLIEKIKEDEYSFKDFQVESYFRY